MYEGNTLLMAAAYDGDGNRVYQLNYNPDKDEDFTAYYRSYRNCDYDGTGIQLRAEGEVSSAERELLALIGSTRTSQYELMEYVNDVNRAYVQVLAEQNGGGRTDTVYTYGAGRTSSERWNQEERTGYYLYDPRGSVAGITDGAGHLTETYRYSASGEMLYGASLAGRTLFLRSSHVRKVRWRTVDVLGVAPIGATSLEHLLTFITRI